MKTENQVVSLEIAKRLKELGVKQESLFVWNVSSFRKGGRFNKNLNEATGGKFVEYTESAIVGIREPYEDLTYDGYIGDHGVEQHHLYSAFTVAELGEMLPMYIAGKYTEYPAKTNRDMFSSAPPEKENIIWEWAIENTGTLDASDTEADARGKMMVYLLENNLISTRSSKEKK